MAANVEIVSNSEYFAIFQAEVQSAYDRIATTNIGILEFMMLSFSQKVAYIAKLSESDVKEMCSEFERFTEEDVAKMNSIFEVFSDGVEKLSLEERDDVMSDQSGFMKDFIQCLEKHPTEAITDLSN